MRILLKKNLRKWAQNEIVLFLDDSEIVGDEI